MQNAAFYEAGISQARGPRRVVVFSRRLLRRILRPMLFHLDAELKQLRNEQRQLTPAEALRNELGQLDADRQAMVHRQDLLEQQLKAALALGWDQAALARRLAAIEDLLNETDLRRLGDRPR